MAHSHRLPANLACAVLLALATAPGCAAWRRSTEAQVIQGRRRALEGMEAVDRGDWGRAETLFAEAIRLNPRDERTHWRYAEAVWRRGDVQSAARHLEESVRLSADDKDLLIRLGQLRLEQDQLLEAQSLAQRAVSLAPARADARKLLGDVHRRRGRPEEALANYHQAMVQQPNDPALIVSAAEVYRDLNQPQRAFATLDVLGEEQGGRQVWELRAWALQGMRQEAEAELARRRASADTAVR